MHEAQRKQSLVLINAHVPSCLCVRACVRACVCRRNAGPLSETASSPLPTVSLPLASAPSSPKPLKAVQCSSVCLCVLVCSCVCEG